MKMKNHATDWEKKFTIHISVIGSVLGYINTSQLSHKKTNNTTNKLGQVQRRYFIIEGMGKNNKPMKR